jgi:hypothetical protein
VPSVSAHDASLGIVSLLQLLGDGSSINAFEAVKSYLIEQSLLEDLQPTLAICDGGMKVQLEPRSDFGRDVVAEMVSFERIPCPEGMCEFSGNTCRWCGSIQP